MPIGCTRPMMIVRRLITPIATPTRVEPAHQAGVEPLPFAPRGFADGAVALVQLPHHAVGAFNDPIETLCGHLLSSGVSGEGPPSSLAWFTPSARAI